MNRTAVYGALLVALGLTGGVWIGRRGERGRVEPVEVEERLGGPVSASGTSRGASATASGAEQYAIRLERRLELLTSKLAVEAAERHRLEERIEALATELAALRGAGHETVRAAASKPELVAAVPATPAAPSAAAPASPHEASPTMEHALVAAGIDARTATEIKRRRDELALSEIYLRNQAEREGWLDTPGFTSKMAEIEAQRTSIRDEIGDQAYDRYLAALDQPNRVAVDEVLLDSPAAAAGLQAGDVVLSYGETRIFAPGELVSATRSGTAGENVQIEIIRQGQRLEVEMPRGPLGIRVAASRGDPGEG